MNLTNKIIRVHLLNNEIAYLTKAGFYLRGRNSSHQVLLIRPKLQEVREVGYPVSHDFEVHNFGGKNMNNSVLIVESMGSGQGRLIGEKSIIQLDGWTPKIIYKVGFRDNLGACAGKARCYSKEIAWVFTDTFYEWKYDLLEVVIVNQGEDVSQMKTTFQINTYTFRNGLFKKTNSKTKAEIAAVSSETPLSN